MQNDVEMERAFGFDTFVYRKISQMNPAEYICWMFQRTENNGTLIVPDWPDEGMHRVDRWLVCRTEWTEVDRDRAAADCETLYAALFGIAEMYLGLGADDREEYEDFLGGDLHAVWSTYLCPLHCGAVDEDDIRDIRERMEVIRACEDMRLREAFGETLSEEEKAFLRDRQSVRVEHGERLLLNAYDGFIEKLAIERVGEGPFAVLLVTRAQQLWRMMIRRAPQICIRYEMMRLAQTMALHRFANDVTTVTPV